MGDTASTPDGRPNGAIHGYLDMVARLARKRTPDQIIHCFDHDWRPMARTQIYPGYKAGRPPEPETLTPQFEWLRTVLSLAGQTQAQTIDWEAEDAIGGCCARAEAGDHLEIVSGDRDLIQLVHDPDIKLLYTLRGVSELAEYDEAGVMAKYGVPPTRYCDFAILRGDPSDGLPGIPSVGEKTALALCQTYPTLDALLEDAARAEPLAEGSILKRKPALCLKLRESVNYIAAMRELVPINSSAPLDLWEGERDDETLDALAGDLGLTGPIKRLRASIA